MKKWNYIVSVRRLENMGAVKARLPFVAPGCSQFVGSGIRTQGLQHSGRRTNQLSYLLLLKLFDQHIHMGFPQGLGYLLKLSHGAALPHYTNEINTHTLMTNLLLFFKNLIRPLSQLMLNHA